MEHQSCLQKATVLVLLAVLRLSPESCSFVCGFACSFVCFGWLRILGLLKEETTGWTFPFLLLHHGHMERQAPLSFFLKKDNPKIQLGGSAIQCCFPFTSPSVVCGLSRKAAKQNGCSCLEAAYGVAMAMHCWLPVSMLGQREGRFREGFGRVPGEVCQMLLKWAVSFFSLSCNARFIYLYVHALKDHGRECEQRCINPGLVPCCFRKGRKRLQVRLKYNEEARWRAGCR